MPALARSLGPGFSQLLEPGDTASFTRDAKTLYLWLEDRGSQQVLAVLAGRPVSQAVSRQLANVIG
jgi:hypothetical protein